MKLKYRVKKAARKIQDNLNTVNRLLAKESIKYLGKTFNSADGWQLSGERKGLKDAIEILEEHQLHEYL